MTTADKLTLTNLINNATSMKKVVETANTPYFDEKIADYANDAIVNYQETRDTILKMVNENKPLFFNLKKMPFHHGCFPEYVERGEVGTQMAGRMIHIAFKIDTCKNWNAILSRDGGYWWYQIDENEIDIQNVFAYTSDTKLPEYRICSSWSLVDKCGNIMRDTESAHTAKEWNEIYLLATMTRAQTELLIKEFKAALEYKINGLRTQANQAEMLMEQNSKVGNYEKITL